MVEMQRQEVSATRLPSAAALRMRRLRQRRRQGRMRFMFELEP
jgi:hypothetical protein